jgi:hypothetical protein
MRFVRNVALSIVGILAGLCLAVAAPAQEAAATPTDLQWGVKIPLRDGVRLNATVFRPHTQKESLPVIFTFTPYISDSYTDRAEYFAGHGYVYVLVDVRGRGNSEGGFEPFANEGRDGYDVVEWLARQSWSNGKVTMWGGSYAGFDQWTTLKEFPAHLATIVPAAAAHPGVDFPFQYNISSPYIIQWITFTSGVTSNAKLFGDSAFWGAKWRELYAGHRAFNELDRVVGNPSPIFQKWLQHPTPDAYLDAMAPSPEQYRKIAVPILTITGDYDGDQPGAFTYYKRHMQYGTEQSKANHYLIIGPWDHAGTRTPQREFGGMKFGEASMLDMNKLHTEWYDWTLKGGPKPAFLKKRVAYYVAGAEEWKYADTLEGIAGARRTLYLASDGAAESVFHSGRLAEKSAPAAASDHWTYDPLDTRAAQDVAVEERAPYTTQSGMMNLRGNGAVYHSEVFDAATEVSGFPTLTLWLSMDVPDTDLQADLYEILPDGSAVLLTSTAMRARYRESLRQEKLVTPGKMEKYVFDNFTFFSRRIAQGSRLRLLLRCPNTPDIEKNYNGGGVVAAESGKDARTAHVTLWHDAEHPSTLELPIVKAGE